MLSNVAAFIIGLGGLFLIEAALRIFDVGPSTRLFVQDGEIYRLNENAARRFFPRQLARRSPLQVQFGRDKPQRVRRIFVLGASTLLGFPNPPQTAFPNFLQHMLEDVFPQADFEVINCGFTAINSFSIVDFAQEIVDYQPDLILVYAGHNNLSDPMA